jgi:phosphatidylserine/phosphatidylglycerophosphate/cardiolipin synthase-like enzyme
LNATQHTLDIGIFFITHDELVQTLIDLVAKDVKVRIICDKQNLLDENMAVYKLAAKGIKVQEQPP